jgi:O-acetylserine/cysteine efflux transporter
VPLLALLLCLLAALSWACGNVIARAAQVPGGLALTVWSGLVVPLPALGLSWLVDGRDGVLAGLAAFGWEAALSTLYTAVMASLVGYGLFNGLLARNPAPAVVPWILLVPVVGILSAWLLLGERPSAGEVTGGVLLLGGALVATRPARGGLAAHGRGADGETSEGEESDGEAGLGVGRPGAGQGGERGLDPSGGVVGGPLPDLLDGAERR